MLEANLSGAPPDFIQIAENSCHFPNKGIERRSKHILEELIYGKGMRNLREKAPGGIQCEPCA